MEAGEFLKTLWGNPPPGQVLIWTLPQKRSIWYNRLDDVQVSGFAHLDVYTGVGVAPSGVLLRTAQRATAEMIGGIAGAWADVDYAGKDHTKLNLPPTEADAWELINAMPIPPTIVVHTGHGLQAWWLFDKPWIFKEGEREQAQAMIRGWQSHMAELAEKRGWVVDATHDLSRLMRLPGTFNNKSDRVPVKVLSSGGPRYSREEFPALAAVAPTNGVIVEQTTIGTLTLDPAVEPPFEKFLALMENDPKFKRSWGRRRSDLLDQSASSYDMSLASFAVTAGWSDQETVNLLIASRRHNGDDLKLREDYYARTLAKARGPAEQAQIQQELEEVAAGFLDNPTLAGMSEVLGVEITDLVKELGDPPEYWLGTASGNITLGTVKNILDQGRFRDAIAAATGTVLHQIKRVDWENRSRAILACCRDYDLNEISDQINETCHWIEDYLDSQTVLDDPNIAAQQGLPFYKDGVVYFTLGGFKNHLRFNVGEPLSSKKLGTRFRLSDVQSERVFYSNAEGAQTSRNYWGYKRN